MNIANEERVVTDLGKNSLESEGSGEDEQLIPKGTRTAFRAEDEQFSERSDAGTSIVEQVFVFVKENLSAVKAK